MKEPGIIYQELFYRNPTQKNKNDHIFLCIEQINEYAIKWNKTFEWRQIQIDYIIFEFGVPQKLNFFQRIFT